MLVRFAHSNQFTSQPKYQCLVTLVTFIEFELHLQGSFLIILALSILTSSTTARAHRPIYKDLFGHVNQVGHRTWAS